MAKILVVDDENLILNVLKAVLSSDGHESVALQDPTAALAKARSDRFDLIITDLRMSPMDGIEFLRQVRGNKISIPVIMMTGYGTVKTAIEALSLDVFDYVAKPFKVEEFLSTVRQALLYGQTESSSQDSEKSLDSVYTIGSLIAASPSMLSVCDMIKRVSPVDIPVLISGEYGVGREAIARTIHDFSGRKTNRFMSVPCGELPEPLFEAMVFGTGDDSSAGVRAGSRGYLAESEGGTMLLTDIDLLATSLLEKFQGIMQAMASVGKPLTGVRFIGAITDKPEPGPDGDGGVTMFRRLGAVEIKVPPLRDRHEDILPLARHILKQKMGEGQAPPSLAPDARDALIHYNWPGNVSELDKAIEHGLAHLNEGKITRQSLPPRLVQKVPAGTPDDKAKRDQLLGKNKALKAFLSKPLQQLRNRPVSS